jgi:hypothetical protein
MDKLREALENGGKQELGIPVVLPSLGECLEKLFPWVLQGKAIEGRQLWFPTGNQKEILSQLPPEVRGRIMPVDPHNLHGLFQRGPYDALLIPKHGFDYSDPNLMISDFWKRRGSYKAQDIEVEEYTLWFWTPFAKRLKLFGLDHHHAVLWDIKKILRPLGIQLDFVWLCDGRPPVNESIPSQIPGFSSSLDIYKASINQSLPEPTRRYILENGYDGILTSHSLVTCFRLQELGLPMIHVNSTRFGNEWINDSKKHDVLVKVIQGLLHQDRLHIVHNNRGDLEYFHQYFPTVSANQEVLVSSLCEGILRFRHQAPMPPKILIWDTRFVLLQEKGSPFMKEFFTKCKETLGESIDSQAILFALNKTFLPEGYLNNYTAVVHIPYNISTMSITEQVRANIPIWVPSKRLLASLWADSKEPNELSWTVFSPGAEKQASPMDNVRDPAVIEKWLDTADFYNTEQYPLCLQFDSIEEFLEKALTTDYQLMVQKAEESQQGRRENIIFAWEQATQHFRDKPKAGTN